MPEPLLKVRLVLVNTESAGKRFRVDQAAFTIGRHEDCDLRIGSSTLSRRHCELFHDSDGQRLFVRDLGSRNGTRVNDQMIGPDQHIELFHHDLLHVGRVTLRMSIKDIRSGQPRARDSKSTIGSILDELDQMAETGMLGPAIAKTEFLLVPDPNRRAEANSSTLPLLKSEPSPPLESSDPNQLTVGIEPYAATVELTAANEPATETETTAAEPEKKKKEPMKLPEHLLHPKTADSQEAATAALRRLFSGGY